MKTYLRHRSFNVIDVKEIIALEYLDFEGKYKHYKEKHDFCEICFVQSGEISVHLTGKKVKLCQNEIIFIEPNTEHSYYSKQGNYSKAFVVCFACSSSSIRLLKGNKFELSASQINCQNLIIEESKSTYRMNEKDQLELLQTPCFGGQQGVKVQLEYLLISLIRNYSVQNSSNVVFLDSERFYPDLVKIITEYLKSNVGCKITLDDVCSKFNYSRSFICKIFKEQTGQTLITYLNCLKIEEIKRLLSNTTLSVADISERLGYTEPKYLSSSFKKATGYTPIEYRTKLKNKE